MAEIAVSKLTQVVNHAAIGNCFVAVQKGAGAAGKAIALNGYVATSTGNAPLGSVS